METAVDTSPQEQLPSERIAGGLLPKVLTTMDMVAIFVGIVLFISNASIMTGAGPAAYVYWVLGFLTFLIPGAIITGQLGRMFPGEGSIYVWTHKAFGPLLGLFAGFCAWFPGVLGLVATGDGAVSLIQLLHPGWLADPWQQGVVIMLIIAFSCLLSILRFRLTQTMVNIVFVLYGGAILLVGLAGVLALLHGTSTPVDYSLHNWLPQPATLTFYGTVILGLLGIEVPLNMGVEIKEARAVTRYLFWGAIVIMAAYLFGTFGVMTAVPLKDQGNPASVAEAVVLGFGGSVGPVLGTIVNLIFIGFFLFTTAVFNYSFARLLFVSGLDRRLPAVISRVNANKVPWVAIVVQTVLSCIVTILVFILLPLFLQALKAGELATIVYDVLQATLTVIWCVSMTTLFVDVVLIRRKYQEQFRALQLVPSWVFSLCAALGSVASLVGIIVTLTKPWTPLVSLAQWQEWIGALGVIALLFFGGIWLFGRTRPVAGAELHPQEEATT
ncbi:APC family permease [Ktedonosporobacter rubrisoli]|uniref:APC family permease n=1 Tax=Ktedonosporobacter rubrisoli TaxID=2509675 RepID=A0A4P6K3Q3_KTERU|nr:APC family permease [Ktedonosporobacter rubrisoli]QBD82784.1 APC family permease [Ktedonosporobacter rubrisoli]